MNKTAHLRSCKANVFIEVKNFNKEQLASYECLDFFSTTAVF